jgi:hypothetical protein
MFRMTCQKALFLLNTCPSDPISRLTGDARPPPAAWSAEGGVQRAKSEESEI